MEKREILESVKKSRKYSSLSEEVIEKEIERFTKRYSHWKELKLEFIMKEIKTELHKAYGSFQTNKNHKRKKLFEEFSKNTKNLALLRKVLETNVSTKERLGSYGAVYEKIFEITGKPDSILDLGCGLNPLSFPYTELNSDTRYYAYDINEEDIDLIKKFFNLMAINGHAETKDLRDLSNIEKLPGADLCLMFKFLDPIEKSEKGHKLAEEIIKILSEKTQFMVVSFATRTITGKKMNFPARGWIERMLDRIDLKFTRLEFDSEIFYIVSRK